MKLLLTIDQKSALLAGVNAPTSTIHLEVDPAELSQAERDYLAKIMCDGHDCTRDKYGEYGGDDYLRAPILTSPTVEGLRAAIAARIALVADRERKRLEEEAQTRAETTAEIHEALKERPTTVCSVWLKDNAVAITTCSSQVQAKVEVPFVPYIYSPSRAEPEAYALWQAREHEIDAEVAAILAAQLPHLQELAEQRELERLAVTEEYERLYARLPETMRARDDAGFATEAEIRGAIKDLICADAGLTRSTYEDIIASSRLTDDEYLAMESARTSVPEGAKVVVGHTAVTWRTATEEEIEDGDADDDGEVREYGPHIIEVTWTRGGVTAVAAIEF